MHFYDEIVMSFNFLYVRIEAIRVEQIPDIIR